MPALFPRWSNFAIRFALAGFVATVTLLLVGLMVYVRTSYGLGMHYAVDQPVEFDHRHHVRDNGIDCRFCHTTVETAPHAGIPSTGLCMGCHAQIWSATPMLDPVRRSWFSGEPIPWNRVHNLPDFAFFDHSIHVNKGIGCESCHGRVDLMPRVTQVKPLNMGWCVDCHRDPVPRLRPPEAITVMGWPDTNDPETESEDRVNQEELAARYETRSLTHCSTCHR